MKTGDIVVDRYRLESKLGMGGMGTVWSAEHIQTGRLFALKIMHATVAANDDSRQRFLKEAKASARINHPSVIDVLDVGELPDGALFMAMELLDGMALVDALRLEPALSVRELLYILRDASLALAAAHAVGIVHRDVKPANIFLHRDKSTGLVRPKVLDFGVSKFAFLEESATQTGSLLGSPRYMSPEQARSAAQADGRSDVWSIGVILFEALSGTYPHEGDSFSNLVVAIATVPPKSIAQQAPGVPAELARLVQECLQVRDQRLASCEQLARRIDALLASHDFSDVPCARGKNKKSLDRPADFHIRSHADAARGWEARASTPAAPRVIDEPSTNPASSAMGSPGAPPGGAAAVPGPKRSLFDDPSSAATRPMGTHAPPMVLQPPSPSTSPGPRRPTTQAMPEVQANAVQANTQLVPRPPTPAGYGQETTTIHSRPLVRPEPVAVPLPDASTRLIPILSVDSRREEIPRTTAVMAAGFSQSPPLLPSAPPSAPHSSPPFAPPLEPRDHLVESVSNFNVERYRAGTSSLSGAPPTDSVNTESPLRRSGLGTAIAAASLVVVGLSVGAALFLGRSSSDAPSAAASPPAAEGTAEPGPVAPTVDPALAKAEAPAASPEPGEPHVAPVESAAPAASAAPPVASASASAAPSASSPPATAPASSAPGSSTWPFAGQPPRPGVPGRPVKKCDKADPLDCLDGGFGRDR